MRSIIIPTDRRGPSRLGPPGWDTIRIGCVVIFVASIGTMWPVLREFDSKSNLIIPLWMMMMMMMKKKKKKKT